MTVGPMQFVQEEDPWQRYEKLDYVSRGAHGVVFKARERSTGQIYALKLLRRGSNVDDNVRRELLNHRRLRPHPNITGFKEVRGRAAKQNVFKPSKYC